MPTSRARSFWLPHLRVGDSGTVFRDVQALRAAAVASVVLYHFWPERLPGGYVGVDVFFVISGFLITAHLLREVEATGRLSLRRFWARRIRRLLPVAFLVLVAVIVLVVFVMPPAQRTTNLVEVIAAAFYVENWSLAASSVDYLSSTDAPTLVQHYWSLSVEEQFYLVWPILLIAALWLRRRFSRTGGISKHFVGWLLLSLAGLSLAYGIWATAMQPASAFFVTPTRVWEFAVGGIVAAFALRGRATAMPDVVRAALSWAGLFAIVLACFWYSAATPFPGFAAALPVVGTAMVIVAGTVERRYSPTWWANTGAVQSIGDLSYSIYLWHWPLLLALPYLIAAPAGATAKVAALVIVGVLAWLTKRFVEDPWRQAKGARIRRPAVAFAFMIAGSLIVSAVAIIPITSIRQAEAAAAERAQSVASCLGAAKEFADDPAGCDQLVSVDELHPVPAARLADTELYDCWSAEHEYAPKSCEFGSESAEMRIALVGDSHAASLIPALRPVVESEGWHMDTYLGIRCQIGEDGCQYEDYFADAVRDGDYDAVIVSGYGFDQPSTETLIAEWQHLLDEGIAVVPIRDVPHITESVFACLDTGTTASSLRGCVTPVAQALDDPQYGDRYAGAASALGLPVVDLTPWMCDETGCPAVIGNVVVYRDTPVSHITATFARSLAPAMAEVLPPAVDAALSRVGL